MDTQRDISLLLGLYCNALVNSLPLEPFEIECKDVLNMKIFSGGLEGARSNSPFVLEPSNKECSAEGDTNRSRGDRVPSFVTPINSNSQNHLNEEASKEDLGRKDDQTIFERDWECWDSKSNEFIRHLVHNNFNVSAKNEC